MNFRSNATLRRLLTTLALALGANAQNAQNNQDLATAHPDDFTRQFATCISYAQSLATEAETVKAELPCFKNEIAIQDRRLNINYKLAILSKKSTDQTGLRMYERAWIELRNNACHLANDSTFAPNCTLEWTKQRADQLETK